MVLGNCLSFFLMEIIICIVFISRDFSKCATIQDLKGQFTQNLHSVKLEVTLFFQTCNSNLYFFVLENIWTNITH